MAMKEMIKTVLSITDESSMWKKFNFTVLMKETYSLKKICLDTEDIFALVEDDEVCVMMADRTLQDIELADECPFAGSYPLYFNQDGNRTSPVFRLYAVCEALRQHPELKNADISGVLLTTSEICNADEMACYWNALGITVRCVRQMRYSVSLKHTPLLWENMPAYLGKKPLEKFVNLNKYGDLIESIVEPKSEPVPSAGHQGAKSAKSRCRREEIRLEDIIDHDDPVFHYLGPDGNSTFSSANLPPMQVFPPMENATACLDEMVGLDEIKEHISTLRNFVLFRNKLSAFPDIVRPEISLHSIFKGSPGTGKTTVALLYASVLKEAGIISKGNLLLANGRTSFTGRWVGTEEKNVRMALAAAKGNVLMIDEAYTLASPNEMDYIRNVLPMMLQLLADEEYRDIAVILCGYDHEMEFMLNSNPGLRSRFPNVFHFKDYSVDDLCKIALDKITQNGYKISDDAKRKISEVLEEMYLSRNAGQWANAREVTNLYDKILVSHANRCISSGVEGEDLITITPEDIPNIVKDTNIGCKVKKIGFH